jgi:3-oxoacyl-[acyl-carrier-protein] synthase-3
MRASQASTLAAKRVLAQTQVPLQSIDLLIHAAVSRDRLEPATASYVHQHLGLPAHTQVLDVSNACLGFLNAMLLAANAIELGQSRAALIVSGEDGRPLVEHTIQHLLQDCWNRKSIKPLFANLTIGSGAVAVLLTHRNHAKAAKAQLLGASVQTDTSVNHLCEGDRAGAEGYSMLTEAEKLLDAGINLAKTGWQLFNQSLAWAHDTADRIICHQVGRQHRDRLYQALGIPLEKDFSTYETLGNMGSASLPITLARAIEARVIKPHDTVALLGIGSGLSSMMMGLKFLG